MKVKVSFVVISLNGGDAVVNTVKSIKKLNTKHNFEIFLVDNGSSDGSPQKVKKEFSDVKVIELKKNVGTAAYDYAIKKAKGEYIFFSGGDVEFKSDMLDILVDFLDKNDYTVQVAPKYVDYYDREKIDLGGTWLSRCFYSNKFKDNTLGNENVEIPYVGTGLIRKDFINKFGYLFDNDYFFYGEDVDLGLRIRLLGFNIYYIPKSIAYHMGSASRSIHKPQFLTFLMERNLMRTFLKVLTLKNIFLYVPYVFIMRSVVIIRDIVRLDFINAFSRLKAIAWVFLNFGPIMKKRRKIQKMRKTGDNELFRIFSEKYLFRE